MATRPLLVSVVLLSGALCIFASSCAVGPNYKPPQTSMPSSWVGPTSAPASRPATQPSAQLATWWRTFNDPTMSSLVSRAVEGNLDLKQAQSRLREARAFRSVAIAALGPSATANTSFIRSRTGSLTRGVPASTTNLYQMGLDATWEIDVFGGLRREIEAATADVQAAREDLHNVLVSLAAEVALNYVDLRSFQQRIVIAQENLRAQRHSAELTRRRFEGGFVSALDVANANALVATTESQIPQLESSAQQTIYTLGILLGREPATLVKELSPAKAIPAAPFAPVYVPSDLLRQRPDIRRAEAQLHAATARIGVATAELFPKFSIGASAGFRGNELNNWLRWPNGFWSFGPSMNWAFFNSGANLFAIEVQRALTEQAMLTYQQAVLTALQDVENALIALQKEQEHRRALLDAVANYQKAVELSTQLYTQGQTDFLNVLEAQRSLYAQQDALVQSTGALSTDLVALYKALGGGWVEEETKKK